MKKKKFQIILLLALTFILSVLGMRDVKAATLSAPRSVTVKAYQKTGAKISWKAVAGAKGYGVYRKTSSQGWKRIRTVTNGKTITDSGLKTGERYYYTVRAYKKVNGKTQWGSYNKTGVSVVAGISYLKLNKTSVSLQVGKSVTLKINGTNLKPAWSSKSPAVATVSNGKVVAKKAGTTTITAKLGGRSFTCKVNCTSASTANKDVTKTYKKQVTGMLKTFNGYFGYGCGKGQQFVFDDYARTTMIYLSNLGGIYGKSTTYAQKKLSVQMKLYFGTNTVKLKKFTSYAWPKNPSYLVQNSNGKITYVGGDWGEAYPIGTVKKIEQTSSGKFVVTYRIDMYNEYEKKYYDYMGTYKIYLNKANNKNGFIISNIIRTKTMNVQI